MSDTIGDLVDALGVDNLTIGEAELASAAVVLVKVIDENGDVRLRIAWSDGLAWIERLGMLRAAEHLDLPIEEPPQ